jgi:hypothetical protein
MAAIGDLVSAPRGGGAALAIRWRGGAGGESKFRQDSQVKLTIIKRCINPVTAGLSFLAC